MAREGKITRTEVRFGVDNDRAGSTYQRGAETAAIAPERSWRIMALFIVVPPCGAALARIPRAAIANLRRDERSTSIAPTPYERNDPDAIWQKLPHLRASLLAQCGETEPP
jgi:hypothetical protein